MSDWVLLRQKIRDLVAKVAAVEAAIPPLQSPGQSHQRAVSELATLASSVERETAHLARVRQGSTAHDRSKPVILSTITGRSQTLSLIDTLTISRHRNRE